MQTTWFLVFVTLLIGAIFLFWHHVLSDAGTAITATLFSFLVVAAVIALAYGLSEGRI